MYSPYLPKDVIRSTTLGFFGGFNLLEQRLENLSFTGAIHFTFLYESPTGTVPGPSKLQHEVTLLAPEILLTCVGSQLSRA